MLLASLTARLICTPCTSSFSCTTGRQKSHPKPRYPSTLKALLSIWLNVFVHSSHSSISTQGTEASATSTSRAVYTAQQSRVEVPATQHDPHTIPDPARSKVCKGEVAVSKEGSQQQCLSDSFVLPHAKAYIKNQTHYNQCDPELAHPEHSNTPSGSTLSLKYSECFSPWWRNGWRRSSAKEKKKIRRKGRI